MIETIDSPLLHGIIAIAQQEADAILESCAREEEQLRSHYLKKAEQERQAETALLRVQLDEIARKEQSHMLSMERKRELLRSSNLKSKVLDQVALRMSSLIGTKEYREVLVGWIAEAAIGVDRPEVMVKCSFKEHVDDAMLADARQLVKKTTGKEIVMSFCDEPLSSQGIVVTSVDGKISYDNRVSTRIQRYGRHVNVTMEGDSCRNE